LLTRGPQQKEANFQESDTGYHYIVIAGFLLPVLKIKVEKRSIFSGIGVLLSIFSL
jgi:hypothetical protein